MDESMHVGDNIRRFRKEKGLTIPQLADRSGISKGYLWSLETRPNENSKPSAETIYSIAKALGVSMSDLLGRPLLTKPSTDIPESLRKFARKRKLPQSDVEMLAGIRWRGEAPKTPDRWAFIYDAIRSSGMDDE